MGQLATIYKEGITSIVVDLFRTMMTTEVSPVPSERQSSHGQLTALVAFGGNWKGVLEFECGSAEAIQFARRFMQNDEYHEVNDDVRDALGEFANIVAGNLKALMLGKMTLCTPSVIEGSDYSVRICGGSIVGESWFSTEAGSFAIRLIEDIGVREGKN